MINWKKSIGITGRFTARAVASLLIMVMVFQTASLAGYSQVDADLLSENRTLGMSSDKSAENGEQDTDIPREKEQPKEEEAPKYTETIEVSDMDGLLALAERVNGGDKMVGVLVQLKADIDLSAQKFWTPIGSSHTTPFSGTFDGEEHTISGLTMDENVQGGLFGHLYEATITNLTMQGAQTFDSVGGLYFSAIRTTIENCEKKHGLLNLFSSEISTFAMGTASQWSGSLTPLPPAGGIPSSGDIKITNAEQLARVMYENNVMTEDFAGRTIILETDIDLNHYTTWEPIGSNGTPFKGSFYGGNHTIYNMSPNSTKTGGLFGKVEDGSISNVILYGATVNSAGDSGIVAAVSDSSISGIVVAKSNITAGSAAGIVYEQADNTVIHLITQCAVFDTNIKATSGVAAGIAVNLYNYGITQCAVYGGTIESSGEASGIVDTVLGPGSSYAAVTENVVLGVTFASSVENAGLSMNITGWNTLSDNFISSIDMPYAPGSASDYIGTIGDPSSVTANFTDSQLKNEFFSSGFGYTTSCYWDSSTVNTDPLLDGREGTLLTDGHGHRAYDTNFLTSGAWRPNESYWDMEEGYYPHLKNMRSSNTPLIPDIMALATVAIGLDSPEALLAEAKELHLPSRTMDGNSISWNPTNVVGGTIKQKTGNNTTIFYTDQSTGKVTFDLTASISVTANGDAYTLEKNFTDVGLVDSVLLEDDTLRYPPAGVEFALTDTPALTYFDHAVVNPNPRGMLRLLAQRRDGSFTPEQILACDGTTGGVDNIAITLVGSKYEVRFNNFSYQPGTTYRLVIPEGALDEDNGSGGTKGNYNDEIVLEFTTQSKGSPVIITPDYRKQIVTNTLLTQSDVMSWFEVGSKENTNDMHSAATPTAQLLTTAVTDPIDTLKSLLATPGVYYYVDPAIIGSTRTRGTSTVHIFAVNSFGVGSRKAIAVEIDDLPQWNPEPQQVFHTYWTDNMTSIQTMITSGASGTYTSARGTERLAFIDTDVDAADWAAAQADPNNPHKVKVTAYMYDSIGNRMINTKKELVVYLDRALRYDFNTGPLYYRWKKDRTLDDWKELIEDDIAFIALNFASTANVKFDHKANDYAEDKIYEVNLKTDRQNVTLCDGNAPCTEHDKIKDKVELTFTVKIVGSEDPQERAFWEKIKKDLLNTVEFNDSVARRPRLSYTDKLEGEEFTDDYFVMPADIIEMLRLQPYNTLDLHYSAYRWKFYGHALEELPAKQNLYPLKVTLDNELSHVKKLLGNEPVVGLKFDYVGLLNGRVEFSYDLRLAGGLSREEIESTNFYLYRYIQKTSYSEAKLVPVSDVIVDEDGWASAVLTKLENATYVFADERFGGSRYNRHIGYGSDAFNETEPVDTYYKAKLETELYMFETEQPEPEFAFELSGDIPQRPLAVENAMAEVTAPDAANTSTGNSTSLAIPMTVSIAVIGLAAVTVIVIKRKNGKGV